MLALTNAGYQKRKATSRVKSGLSEIWLPGRTRTPDQLVTSALTFLPGLDYLIIRIKRMSGAVEVYWLGSSTSSLCTFLPTHSPSAGFAQDYHRGKWAFLLRLP